MSNLYGLPDVHFAIKDAAKIKRDIITGFEEAFFNATQEKLTLYPGDPRHEFLSTIASREVLLRNLIDHTGRQNLLATADGEMLDHLGLWLDVERLPPQKAVTTIRFTLSSAQSKTMILPTGIRAAPGNGSIYFATTYPLEIPAGEKFGDVHAQALNCGIQANGLLAGQINRLVDPLPYIQGVVNITTSEGGTDREGDENYRERIHLAPEKFSNAGSRGAYIYWAKSASQLIGDVEPHSPSPGIVNIYVLMKKGIIPEQEMLEKVLKACNDETIRPLTDKVFVLPPNTVSFDFDVTWYLERSNATMAASISKTVEEAVSEWVLWQRSKIGRDINPDELIRLIKNAGAKRVKINSPVFNVLNFNQVAICTEETPAAVYGGIEDG